MGQAEALIVMASARAHGSLKGKGKNGGRKGVKRTAGRKTKTKKTKKTRTARTRRGGRGGGGRGGHVAGMPPVVGTTGRGPPTLKLPDRPGTTVVKTREGVKTVKPHVPIQDVNFSLTPPPITRTTGKPSWENPAYKNACANKAAALSKLRTKHVGTYTTAANAAHWSERERTYPAPQFPAIY